MAVELRLRNSECKQNELTKSVFPSHVKEAIGIVYISKPRLNPMAKKKIVFFSIALLVPFRR